MSFTGNGITNCYPDQVEDFISITVLTVTTYPEPNTAYVVQKHLALRARLELGEDVTILQVPFGAELATLQNGQADIAQTIEPNVSQVENEGGRVVFSYPAAWGPLAFTGVMVSKSLIDSNPNLVQRFLNAYERAYAYIHDDFEGAVAIAQNRLPDIAREIVRTLRETSLPSAGLLVILEV